uniref:Uncharacterized protein n=1 Tax=Panagrolaimus superbus TaxID=310955 RepID=A0A914Z342_9BILA
MKTLLVIFAIICVSYAFVDVDVDEDAAHSSTTESPTDKPPVEVSTLPPPLSYTKNGTINGIGTVFFEIPVQKSQGIVLTITTNKKIALLFVSLDSNNQLPNADKSDYSVACYGDNSFTAQIQIPSNKFDELPLM